MNLSEFEEQYPDFQFLESRNHYTRYSNGLGEGSDDESLWFCDECEEEADPMEGCTCHNPHEGF